ncbi:MULTISPECIES: MBL fold metallo-hydrolase [Veillonella]|uniref:MBL fold metallo-hydrolase n=1 Tax=Veillonella TaxID=29465 RepID=UPI002352AD76|nr:MULTISPECIES: MBL fold metallo-hydrolase [Veillonella]MBS6450014.1 MBL fold metallo-hydrolase [Veillonella sp. oral taxon 158]MDU4763885.1 MBL fold metallo-hydrolase [Veillonella sp.]
MNIIIHRGTHQIGGSAIEISTASTRIILDFGNELSLDEKYTPINLDIEGVTKGLPDCNGIVISHYHMDHLGQLTSALPEIPLYMGELSKEVAMISAEYQDKNLYLRLLGANTFRGGEAFTIGDIRIRPLVIDHSAADSYMFVIEAEGKHVLYTGDFRMHGLRHHILDQLVNTYIGEVDVLITEGTSLSRDADKYISEAAVLDDISSYIQDGKYVFVMCSSTNIDRIMGIWQNMPTDKVLICDAYQKRILDTVINNVYYESSLYRRHDSPLVLNKGSYPKYYMDHGFVSLVRGTENFISQIKEFPKDDVRIIYSMWTGYIEENLALKTLLETYPTYICHASGHVSKDDLIKFIELVNPDAIIPVHTDNPERLEELVPHRNVYIVNDNEPFII